MVRRGVQCVGGKNTGEGSILVADLVSRPRPGKSSEPWFRGVKIFAKLRTHIYQ